MDKLKARKPSSWSPSRTFDEYNRNFRCKSKDIGKVCYLNFIVQNWLFCKSVEIIPSPFHLTLDNFDT